MSINQTVQLSFLLFRPNLSPSLFDQSFLLSTFTRREREREREEGRQERGSRQPRRVSHRERQDLE